MIYSFIYSIYIYRGSYRKLTWLRVALTITEFRSDFLTDWAIRPWDQLALRANFVQLLQFYFGLCLRQICYSAFYRCRFVVPYSVFRRCVCCSAFYCSGFFVPHFTIPDLLFRIPVPRSAVPWFTATRLFTSEKTCDVEC